MIRRWYARRRADRAALATMGPVERVIVRAFHIPPRLSHLAMVGRLELDGRVTWFGRLDDLVVMLPNPRETR